VTENALKFVYGNAEFKIFSRDGSSKSIDIKRTRAEKDREEGEGYNNIGGSRNFFGGGQIPSLPLMASDSEPKKIFLMHMLIGEFYVI